MVPVYHCCYHLPPSYDLCGALLCHSHHSIQLFRLQCLRCVVKSAALSNVIRSLAFLLDTITINSSVFPWVL